MRKPCGAPACRSEILRDRALLDPRRICSLEDQGIVDHSFGRQRPRVSHELQWIDPGRHRRRDVHLSGRGYPRRRPSCTALVDCWQILLQKSQIARC